MISHRKHSVWCFLFVTLFNLQGTRLIGGAIYCTTELWVCQVLFSKFFWRRSQLSGAATFLVYHTQKRLSRTFSEVFEARFRYLSGNHFRLPHLVAAVKCFFHFTLWCSAYRADSFVRIPNHSAFVNTIFQLSSLFLIFTITPPYPSPTSVHFGNQSVQNTHPVL